MRSVVTERLLHHPLTASIDATLGNIQLQTLLSVRSLSQIVMTTKNHFGELLVQVVF